MPENSTARIVLFVVAVVLAVWLVAATIHRLAAIAAYVIVFGIGYFVGTYRERNATPDPGTGTDLDVR